MAQVSMAIPWKAWAWIPGEPKMLTENKRLTYEENFAIADETWCNMLYKQKGKQGYWNKIIEFWL